MTPACTCPPGGMAHDCPVPAHGLKGKTDSPNKRTRSLKAQSVKEKLRSEYLAGIKAGFLYMQARYDPDGPTCESCGVRGNASTLDLDHIIARSKQGHDRPDNLQLLCNFKHSSGHDCHGKKHGVPQFSQGATA